ncbi:MAG: S8 family serine peptidase [Candidatus Zixiibacteriota bacterium]
MPKSMKLLSSWLLVFTLVFMLTSFGYGREYDDSYRPKPYVIKGLVSVQLEDDFDVSNIKFGFGALSMGNTSLDQTFRELQIEQVKKIFPLEKERPPVNSGLKDLTRFYQISFPDSLSVNTVIRRLLQDPNIRMAEPVMAMPLDVIPDDPSWISQWHRNKLDLEHAWDLEAGSDSIKIAIIDSGVNYKHPDLQGNIWVNPGEDLDGDEVVYDLDDMDGVDNDGNGYVDDLIGYDFLTGLGGVWPGEDGGIPDTDPNDFDGHGTHCAGISAAVTNNAVDVVGIAGGWGTSRSFKGSRIMCLRTGGTGSDGYGYVNPNDCATAINYAAAMGAHVINCSWGSSSVQASALQNAVINHGVTVVHAAGNDNSSIPGYMDDAYGVMSVAATTSSDYKASYSNYGAWIDVSAPGSSILSTYSNQYVATTESLSGTSMAAPMVVGLAALIRSAMPSLSMENVNYIIQSTADNIDGINPAYAGMLGAGRINAFGALSTLAIAQFSADVLEGEVPLEVNFTDASPNFPTSWKWYFGDGDSADIENPSHIYTEPGIYDVSLLINDPNGLGEEHLRNYIWARADTIRLDSVMADRGTQTVVPVYFTNTALVKNLTFSFTLPNDDGIKLDSVSLQGTRSEYFYNRQYTGFDFANKRYAVYLETSDQNSSHYLEPGSGLFLKLYITVPSGATPGNLVTIDTLNWGTYKKPEVNTVLGTYWPVFETGKIYIRPCVRGDANCSGGELDIADITALIDYLYIEPIGSPEIDSYAGNVNGVGDIDISDITYLIAFLYLNGPPPPV